MKRIIVAGGRDFSDKKIIWAGIQKFIVNTVPNHSLSNVAIVSGGAKGVDVMGAVFARQFGYPLHMYPANWDTFGNRAGFLRNTLMAENADCLLAFWDGKSRGTADMIETAASHNLKVEVIRYGKT